MGKPRGMCGSGVNSDAAAPRDFKKSNGFHRIKG